MMDHPIMIKEKKIKQSSKNVTLQPITQATTATFTNLYIQNTSLFFIENGSKRVQDTTGNELIGQTGDVIIFQPDSIVTMENRTWSGIDYRAIGVSFTQEMVEKIFPKTHPNSNLHTVQILSPSDSEKQQILNSIKENLRNIELPKPVLEHRLLEPLIWLKTMGVKLSSSQSNSPLGKVRSLIETDLTYPWRANEIAEHFAMSEATMRRWLAQSGNSFSKILINTRLEKGLNLLQTTKTPISDIALDCGFKTPSHFSDTFKGRFGVQPKSIRASKD